MPVRQRSAGQAMTIVMIVSVPVMALFDAGAYLFFAVMLPIVAILTLAGVRRAVCVVYAATVLIFISIAKGSPISMAFDVLLILTVLTSFIIPPDMAWHRDMEISVTKERRASAGCVLRLSLLFLLALTSAMIVGFLSGLLGIRVSSIVILLPVLCLGLLIVAMAGRAVLRTPSVKTGP